MTNSCCYEYANEYEIHRYKSSRNHIYRKNDVMIILCVPIIYIIVCQHFGYAVASICHSDKHHLEHFLRVLDLHRCGLRYRRTFGQLPFGTLHLLISKVVYSSKFNKSREDKGEADSDEPVHRRGVRDLGKRMTRTDAQRRHGEDSSDAFNDKRRETMMLNTQAGEGTKDKHFWRDCESMWSH